MPFERFQRRRWCPAPRPGLGRSDIWPEEAGL